MRGIRAGIAALVGVGLAACGGGGAANPSPSPQPSSPGASASATGSAKYIVIADPSPYAGQTPSTVRFVTLTGQVAGQFTLAANSQVVALGGSRVFVLTQDGHLQAFHREGSVEQLGVIGPAVPFAASPDGRMWAWATMTAQGDMVSSAIHVSGDGMTPRVVERATESGRSLRPYEWTKVGLFVEHGGMGIGGYILYMEATGPVDEVNLRTNGIKPIHGTDSCLFSDMASDGTIACFANDGQHPLRILYPGGRSTEIQLATPRFNMAGDAYFSPNGAQLTVGGAVGSGAFGGSNAEHYGTDLVQKSDASIARLSLDGVRPASHQRGQCWIGDHTLLVYRPENSADGQGIYLYDTSGGSSTQIGTAGVPLGSIGG